MNNKITAYVDKIKSDKDFMKSAKSSHIIDKADNIGQNFQLNLLTLENEYGRFDSPNIFAFLTFMSFALNLILLCVLLEGK